MVSASGVMFDSLSQQIIDALAESVAVVDGDCRIVAANAAWHRAARETAAQASNSHSSGEDLCEFCGRESAEGAALVADLRRGIAGVLAGGTDYHRDYPFAGDPLDRAIRLRVTSIRSGGDVYALVFRSEIARSNANVPVWWSFDPAVQERIRDAVARAAGGETSRLEIETASGEHGPASIDLQIAPLRGASGTITHVLPSAIDITAHKLAETAAIEHEQRLKLALQAGRLGSWQLDLDSDEVWGCETFRSNFGFDENQSVRLADVRARLLPEDAVRLDAAIARARDERSDLDIELGLSRAIGNRHWVALRGRLIEGSSKRMLVGVSGDISERKESEARRMREEHREIAVRELSHRIKNLFAMVSAILTLTARSHTSVAAFREAVAGRLHALEETQTRLAESGWRSASLADIVTFELRPFLERRQDIEVAGCARQLAGNATQMFSMVLHELATNAAKYGALSVPGGRLSIKCREEARDGVPHIVLEWVERGGPPVSPPSRSGFGSTVLRGMVRRMYQAEVELDYAPEGLTYVLSIPRDKVLLDP